MYDVTIIGAGIAGVAAAHYLSGAGQPARILILDREQPLSQTTSKSGENFRGHWPQPCMTALSERSIELMEALSEPFGFEFTGYDFVSERAGNDLFFTDDGDIEGLDRLTDPDQIRSRYPYLADAITQVLRFTSAGWVDVNALGSVLLGQARKRGVEWRKADVTAVVAESSGYRLYLGGGSEIETLRTQHLVLAAGPFNGALAAQLGVELPGANYLQQKIVVPDPLKLVPRDMPFTIFADPQHLHWSEEEQELIASERGFAWLLEEFPAGLHIKPEGKDRIKLGWAYNRRAQAPRREPPPDDHFAGIVMRGASRFLPALAAYVDDMPTPVVTYSGFYTRTEENWPLIGPLGPPGLYTIAALSGYGTMVACAAGELLTAWMTNAPLPPYAKYFDPDRYNDPEIVAEIASLTTDGQL